MGMSAGDEKRLRTEIAPKRGVVEVPTEWLKEMFAELDYWRKRQVDKEFGFVSPSKPEHWSEFQRKIIELGVKNSVVRAGLDGWKTGELPWEKVMQVLVVALAEVNETVLAQTVQVAMNQPTRIIVTTEQMEAIRERWPEQEKA